jgi:hypothetical protein
MRETIDSIASILATFPKTWEGKAAILEMRKNGFDKGWRQNEWIGWYFEYLCSTNLPKAGMKIPGTKIGRAEFDGNLGIDWDFKSHPIHNKDGKEANDLIVNDMEAIVATIKQNGSTGIIVAQGEATFNDVDMSFRRWHSELKGGLSRYSQANIARGAGKRLYKVAFELKHIDIYLINKDDLENQGRFQEGMRNSNGKPRREKLKIDLSTLEPVGTIKF